jgi:hypothetical protein
MSLDEAERLCDELQECVDSGPGENPDSLRRALTVVRKLRHGATWDYPVTIVLELEAKLVRWFSPDSPREADAGEHSRQSLLEYIARLEGSWDRPRA